MGFVLNPKSVVTLTLSTIKSLARNSEAFLFQRKLEMIEV